MLIPSPLESRRFGLRICRATLARIDSEKLFDDLVEKRIDLAIIRTPVRIPNGLQAFEARGIHAIHADTLVSYKCRLAEYEPQARNNHDLRIEPARAEDSDAILALIQAVFAEYPNHYRANPLLPVDAIVAGYGEWALSHLSGVCKVAWVVRVDDRIAALACSSFDDSGLCQGTLHGVHPDFAGSGIYTDLIRHTQHYFRERGCHTLRIQTQVGNLPVQRVWAREGFTFAEVFDTFHIIALLDTDPGSRYSVHLSTPADPEVPPHSQEIATRFLAAVVDEAAKRGDCATNTVPGSCRVAVWQPIVTAGNYEARVRTYPTASGRDLVSATLHDADGKVCGVARCSVFHGTDGHNGVRSP